MNKEKILFIIKKYSLLLFYVIWYLPFFLFFRYYDTMDLLEKMGVNGKIFDMLVYLFLPFFFILYFLTPKLWKYFGQFAGRKIFFTLLILSFIIPVNQFSRVMYLKHFIKAYESAVSYALEKDCGWDYQLIKLPSEYDEIFRYINNYVYFMRDDNSIKIFFERNGIIKNKGYLYTIDYSNRKKLLLQNYWTLSIPTMKLKTEGTGLGKNFLTMLFLTIMIKHGNTAAFPTDRRVDMFLQLQTGVLYE